MNQRRHPRILVEFPAIFKGEGSGVGIVYNPGIGGCKAWRARIPQFLLQYTQAFA